MHTNPLNKTLASFIKAAAKRSTVSPDYVPPRYRDHAVVDPTTTAQISNTVLRTSELAPSGGLVHSNGYIVPYVTGTGTTGTTPYHPPLPASELAPIPPTEGDDIKRALIDSSVSMRSTLKDMIGMMMLLRAAILDLSDRVEEREMLQDDDDEPSTLIEP